MENRLAGVQILSVVPGRNRPDAGKMRIAPTGVPHAWALVPVSLTRNREKGGNGIIQLLLESEVRRQDLDPGLRNTRTGSRLRRGPMVLLNLAAMIRPGWFHDSSITPSELLPQPKPLEGGPICQESFVYLSINVRVFVRLMSPRAFSRAKASGRSATPSSSSSGKKVEVTEE